MLYREHVMDGSASDAPPCGADAAPTVRPAAVSPASVWSGGRALDQAALAELLCELGLRIVHEREGRRCGPIPLWEFARRLSERLDMPPVSAGELCDAVRATLSEIDHPRLRLLAPGSLPGAGYVYDDEDPGTWPARSSPR